MVPCFKGTIPMKRAPAAAALLLLLFLPPAFAASPPSYVELADAPTIAVDWSKGSPQSVTLGGNRTMAFSNGEKGRQYMLVLKQDATGSRTVTWPVSVHWPGGNGQPTLTTTANRKDYITFVYDGANYDALAFTQNY